MVVEVHSPLQSEKSRPKTKKGEKSKVAESNHIEVDSIESVTVENTTKKSEKEDEEDKKKKVSPKIFLKEKASSALNKLKGMQHGNSERAPEPIAARTRSQLQPVAARTKSKTGVARKPRDK